MNGADIDNAVRKATQFFDNTGRFVPNLGGAAWHQKLKLKRFVLRKERGYLDARRILLGEKYQYEFLDFGIDDIGVLVAKNGDSGGGDFHQLLKDESDAVITQTPLTGFTLTDSWEFTVDDRVTGNLTRSADLEFQIYFMLKEFHDAKLQELKTELFKNWRFNETCPQWEHISQLRENHHLCFIKGIIITKQNVHLHKSSSFSWTLPWLRRFLMNYLKDGPSEEASSNSHVAYSTKGKGNAYFLENSTIAYAVVPLKISASDGSISLPEWPKAGSGDNEEIDASKEIGLCNMYFNGFNKLDKNTKTTVRNALIRRLNCTDIGEQLSRLNELAREAFPNGVDPDALPNEVEPRISQISNLLNELGIFNVENQNCVAEGIYNFISVLSMLPAEVLQLFIYCATKGNTGCTNKVAKDLIKIIENKELGKQILEQSQDPSDTNATNFDAFSVYDWRVVYTAAIHMFGK